MWRIGADEPSAATGASEPRRAARVILPTTATTTGKGTTTIVAARNLVRPPVTTTTAAAMPTACESNGDVIAPVQPEERDDGCSRCGCRSAFPFKGRDFNAALNIARRITVCLLQTVIRVLSQKATTHVCTYIP